MIDALHVVCPSCDTVNRVSEARLTENPQCGRCRYALFSHHPLALDESRFFQHLSRSDLPLLVDFWAPWCGPCRTMAPAFEAVAATLEPRIRLIKINTEESQALASQYAIRSIPTLVLFQKGQERQRIAGALTTPQILAWVRQSQGV